MEQKKIRSLSGVVSLTASALFVKVLGFLYKIPLSHILSDEGMGYYNTALNVYALFYILSSCAIPKALSVALSKARIYQTKQGYKKTFISLASILCFLGMSMSLVLYLLSGRISNMLGFSNASQAILFISPTVIFTTLASICKGYLLSYGYLGCVGVSECIEAAIKLLGGISFVYFGTKMSLSIPSLGAFAVLGVTLGGLISFLYLFIASVLCKKEDGEFRGIYNYSIKNTILSFFKISIPLTLGSLLYSLAALLDLRMITTGLLKAGVSHQEAAQLYGNYSTLVLPLLSFVNSIASAFALSLFPTLCRCYENKDENQFKRIIHSALHITFFFSLFTALGFFYFGEDYFVLLFKSESVFLGVQTLKISSFGVILIAVLTLINTALEARGRHGVPLLSFCAGILIKIPVGFYAIFRFGIMGAAFSSVVSYAISLLISFVFLKEEIKDFIPSIKKGLICFVGASSAFCIGVLSKNMILNVSTQKFTRIIPIAITCCFCLVFVLFISKTLSKDMKTLSKCTKTHQSIC